MIASTIPTYDPMTEPPKAKKPKWVCHFDRGWIREFPGISVSSKGKSVVADVYVSSLSGESCYLTHYHCIYYTCLQVVPIQDVVSVRLTLVLLMVAEMMSQNILVLTNYPQN